MCGIIGTVPNSKINLKYINHRGPDANGLQTVPDKLTFGHTRLSILDLTSNGSQPRYSQSGNVLVTYNGEIYNYKEISTIENCTCDTISLIDNLDKNGINFIPSEFNGMYAFSAYFKNEDKLVLLRDPVGIKPLYIYINEDKIAFCSEIKGFFGVDWYNPIPNDDVQIQSDFLRYGYTFPQDVEVMHNGNTFNLNLVPTLIKNLYSLTPGIKYIYCLKKKTFETNEYTFKEESKNPIDLIRNSVLEQSMSDVEVGVQLSGGIDSSIVANEYSNIASKVHGFYVSVNHKNLNEDKWVEIVRKNLSKKTTFVFHKIILNKKEIKRVISSSAWFMDEPMIRHPNAMGIYLLSEYVKKHTNVKVLLTGEGADEIFGGYSWHTGDTLKDYGSTRVFFETKQSPIIDDFILKNKSNIVLNAQLNYDRKFYLPPILLRQDRMTMAHSIESRVPFLSNDFLNLGTPDKPGKIELKKYAADLFGEEFAYREKYGFGLSWDWLNSFKIETKYLKWLKIEVTPKTNEQKWALIALSIWSKHFLYNDRKENNYKVPSQSFFSKYL